MIFSDLSNLNNSKILSVKRQMMKDNTHLSLQCKYCTKCTEKEQSTNIQMKMALKGNKLSQHICTAALGPCV